jgi:hypothetical protein
MEKDMRLEMRNEIEDNEDDILVAPYYIITYIDDYNRTHLATIKDTLYLQFIKDRFYVKECRYIPE